MRTNYSKVTGFLLILFMLVYITTPTQAQQEERYIIINGIVKDQKTKKKLEYVNISISGTNIGTVTNADGAFSIKVNDNLYGRTLEFSHVGYYNQKFPIGNKDVKEITIQLTPHINLLQEIIVQSINVRKLVEQAVDKVANNYSPYPSLLTGFYRETIKKRNNYINISEAIINIYKTAYSEDINQDRIQVYKGRQLLSPKRGDTLIVKLQGGPNLSVYLDAVKNRNLMLDPASLSDYKFKMEKSTMINERPHYVVSFEPQIILPYPLMYGKLYIDEESLAFSRAELNLSMDDRDKVTRVILKKKPFNLRFKPEEISYLVTYKQQNGRTYLSYIRSEVVFSCDWKRKLFSTNYSIVSEMVVTDRKEQNVVPIPDKLVFNDKYSLSDKVSNFYDENFWEDYNIIAPTESLEAAVNKLKKTKKN
ncbi:hypothetical protein EZS27_003547 [termite gut metagenome]|uniref:TonB-dependent receptor SusC n=1 Tax=termite gut metagenome TaxID=433724 RepID=A0A5J4SV41_9ZZZZ